MWFLIWVEGVELPFSGHMYITHVSKRSLSPKKALKQESFLHLCSGVHFTYNDWKLALPEIFSWAVKEKNQI